MEPVTDSEVSAGQTGFKMKGQNTDCDGDKEQSPQLSDSEGSTYHIPSTVKWTQEQRRNRRFCDILIHATRNPEPAGPDPGSQPIHAHKIILGDVSPFFAQALSNSDESLHEFIINGIDKSTLEYLIDYIYCKELEPLTEESVFMIYTGAQMLLLETVVTECVRFIESSTTSENAIINWIFGEVHQNDELICYATNFILTHLDAVSKTDGFRNLTPDKLLNLIVIGNDRKICLAQDLLLATISWLKSDLESRRNIISQIMREIPLNLIDLDTLKQCFKEDQILKTINTCVELYYETIETILFEQQRREREKPLVTKAECSGESQCNDDTPNNRNRLGSSLHFQTEDRHGMEGNGDTSSRNSLDCCPDSTESGQNSHPSNQGDPSGATRIRRRTASSEPASPKKRLISTPSKKKGRKNTTKKTKSKLHPLIGCDIDQIPCSSSLVDPRSMIPSKRLPHAYNRNPVMYFVCGEKQSTKRKIMIYDFRTGQYEKLTSYPFTSEKSCLVYHRGSLYDIGGRSNDKAFIRVKIFDIITEEWRKNPIPTLAERRSDFNCAILDGYIYAVGGCDSYGGINCVERLPPPEKDKTWLWEEVEYMQRARDNCGVCVCDGKIYAVGGFVADSEKFGAQMVVSDSVECYDPVCDKWTFRNHLPTKRHGLAVAVVHSLVYAIGGGSTVEPPHEKLKIVEAYDWEKDSWIPRAEMNRARQFFSVVVVDEDIFAIGGDSDDKPSIERFDTARNEWLMVGELRPDGDYRSIAFRSGE